MRWMRVISSATKPCRRRARDVGRARGEAARARIDAPRWDGLANRGRPTPARRIETEDAARNDPCMVHGRAARPRHRRRASEGKSKAVMEMDGLHATARKRPRWPWLPAPASTPRRLRVRTSESRRVARASIQALVARGERPRPRTHGRAQVVQDTTPTYKSGLCQAFQAAGSSMTSSEWMNATRASFYLEHVLSVDAREMGTRDRAHARDVRGGRRRLWFSSVSSRPCRPRCLHRRPKRSDE